MEVFKTCHPLALWRKLKKSVYTVGKNSRKNPFQKQMQQAKGYQSLTIPDKKNRPQIIGAAG
jgi:hypothetical protein